MTSLWQRANKLYQSWTKQRGDVDALCIVAGKRSEDEEDTPTSLFMQYLMGLEFTDSMFVFLDKTLVVYASEKKWKHIQECQSSNTDQFKVEFVARPRKPEGWEEATQKLVDLMRKSFNGKVVATFQKEWEVRDCVRLLMYPSMM